MEKSVSNIVLRSGRETDLLLPWENRFSSNLKNQSLLFDQFGILRLKNIKEVMSSSIYSNKNIPEEIKTQIQTFISDTEWLEEKEIIFEAKLDDEFRKTFFNLNPEDPIIKEITNLVDKLDTKSKSRYEDDPLKNNESILFGDGIILRAMSLIIEANKKILAATSLPYTEYINELHNTTKSDVVQIVINKLPLPNGTISWEQVIDYRNDTENQKNLLHLRRWIRKISAQEIAQAEIEEEIDWLMNEFQSHMNLHKMKANTETLEVIVKAPLEIIENLVKLKFSKIPEPFFAVKKRQINLMEAELNAPGREMAYIIKAKDTFQSDE